MQLKQNSDSFTEQVDSSNIAWSHRARAWVKHSQAEKQSLSELPSVLPGFWRHSLVVFQLNIYQASHWSLWKAPENAMRSYVWTFSA